MAFKNRVRLPFHLTRPQFPDERNITRLADGSTRTRSVVVRKTYEGETDYLPEWIHQRLKIALVHDIVSIEGLRYLGGVSIDGEYEIDWQKFQDFPYAQAKFTIQVTPFNATNSNCQSCDEAEQLNLVDDNLPGTLEQSQTYTFNVFDNDTINCFPFTAQVMWYHFAIIQSASISPEGVLTLVTRPLFFPRNGILLCTYRVTCPNGGYDEAGVYATVTGEEESCLEPISLQTTDVNETSASVQWTAPSPAPSDGYQWKYAKYISPATIIEEGTQAGTTLTIPTDEDDLDPETAYIFSVRSVCDLEAEEYSEWVDIEIRTSAQEGICGKYWVEIYDGHGPFKDISYLGCAGRTEFMRLLPYQRRSICALQNGPGDPVSIIGADLVVYFRPC